MAGMKEEGGESVKNGMRRGGGGGGGKEGSSIRVIEGDDAFVALMVVDIIAIYRFVICRRCRLS